MAYLESAISISVNSDNTFNIFVKKAYLNQTDQGDGDDDYDDQITLSATDKTELIKKLTYYIDKLQYAEDDDYENDLFNKLINADTDNDNE